MIRARRIYLTLLIMGACLLPACAYGLTETPLVTSPTISTQSQPYPIATPLSKPSESPYPKPGLAKTRIASFYQTQTAAPSSTPKSALQTRIASVDQTLTARPTATPTPTFPVDALPCQAPDLGISARTQGFPTFLQFSVSIINISHSTCYLQGPADIKLVDSQGDVLDLEYSSVCFGCRIDHTLPSPTRTAIASELLYGKIGIAPNERVGVWADWSEWCKPLPVGGIFVRLILPGGFVEGPTDAYVGAPCWLDGDRSHLSVSRYDHLPWTSPWPLIQAALTYDDIPYSDDPLYNFFIDSQITPSDNSRELIDLCGIDCVKRIWTDTAERRSFVIVMYQVKDPDQAKKKVEETLAHEIKTFSSDLITGTISLPELPPHSWIAASNGVKGVVSDFITLQTTWGPIVVILSEQGDIKPDDIPLDDYFIAIQRLAVLQLQNLKRAGYIKQ